MTKVFHLLSPCKAFQALLLPRFNQNDFPFNIFQLYFTDKKNQSPSGGLEESLNQNRPLRHILISVANLPADDENRLGIHGPRAITCSNGQGAIVQIDKHLYELQCQVNGCSWNILPQKLKESVRSAVIFALPEDFGCE